MPIARPAADKYPAHFKAKGYNAFYLNACANSWVRNVSQLGVLWLAFCTDLRVSAVIAGQPCCALAMLGSSYAVR